jgi:hypothetical protein
MSGSDEAARGQAERLVDEVVRGARIPSRRGREELRRELWSHFEDCEREAGNLAAALRRFGDPREMAAGFRHVHRRGYRLFYGLKLAASLVASALVALLIQAAANLRPAGAGGGGGAELWQLGPSFPRTALISVAVALGAVAAWESLRRPVALPRVVASGALYAVASIAVEVVSGGALGAFLSAGVLVAIACAATRLEIRPQRLAAVFLAFSVVIYGVHRAVGRAPIACSAAAPGGGTGIALPQALLMSAALLAVWAASLAILSRCERAFGRLVGQT